MNASSADTAVDQLAPHEHLSGKLGVLRIASMVIAFSAPLAVVSGFLAVVIALGNGLGAPAAFIGSGIVLMLFSVGFTEAVKSIPASGGFYIYITAGLGRPLGLAGTLLAITCYFFLASGTYSFFGLAANRLIGEQLGGPNIPWWLFVAGAWLVSTILSYRELSVSARVLVVSIILEFALMLYFDASVGVTGGAEGYSAVPFSIRTMFSGSLGLALLYGVSVFMGFESTAIYRDEARQPERTIPRATYLTVIFMTAFYSCTTYMLILALGPSRAIDISVSDPARAFTVGMTTQLGHTAATFGYLLLCTSLYGAILAMHNVISRYVFKLATTGLIFSSLGHVHPRYKAPSRSALATAVLIACVLLPFAIMGVDPALLYARLIGVGTFGIILLLFITSVALIFYFRRTKTNIGIFKSFIAPMLASIFLLLVFVLSNLNFTLMVGTSFGASIAIVVAIYAVIAAGLIWALWLKKNRPGVFAQIGQD